MFYSFKDSYDYTYSYDLREKLFLYESESCNRIDYPFIRMITLNMIVNYDHKRIREFFICAILCLEQLCGGFVTGFTRVGVQRRYFTLLKFGVSLRICSEKPWHTQLTNLVHKNYGTDIVNCFVSAAKTNLFPEHRFTLSLYRILFMVDFMPKTISLYKYFDTVSYKYSISIDLNSDNILCLRLLLSYYTIPMV